MDSKILHQNQYPGSLITAHRHYHSIKLRDGHDILNYSLGAANSRDNLSVT